MLHYYQPSKKQIFRMWFTLEIPYSLCVVRDRLPIQRSERTDYINTLLWAETKKKKSKIHLPSSLHQIYGTRDQTHQYHIHNMVCPAALLATKKIYCQILNQSSLIFWLYRWKVEERSWAIQGSLMPQIHSEALKDDLKITSILYIRLIC